MQYNMIHQVYTNIRPFLGFVFFLLFDYYFIRVLLFLSEKDENYFFLYIVLVFLSCIYILCQFKSILIIIQTIVQLILQNIVQYFSLPFYLSMPFFNHYFNYNVCLVLVTCSYLFKMYKCFIPTLYVNMIDLNSAAYASIAFNKPTKTNVDNFQFILNK